MVLVFLAANALNFWFSLAIIVAGGQFLLLAGFSSWQYRG